MCRCDICKRRSRTVTIISRKVVCMICLGAMLGGGRVWVRGESGEEMVILNAERELVFGLLKEPVPVSVPKPVFVPTAGGLQVPDTGVERLEDSKVKDSNLQPSNLQSAIPVRRGPGRPRKVEVEA